jgi:hypothetical protein
MLSTARGRHVRHVFSAGAVTLMRATLALQQQPCLDIEALALSLGIDLAPRLRAPRLPRGIVAWVIVIGIEIGPFEISLPFCGSFECFVLADLRALMVVLTAFVVFLSAFPLMASIR